MGIFPILKNPITSWFILKLFKGNPVIFWKSCILRGALSVNNFIIDIRPPIRFWKSVGPISDDPLLPKWYKTSFLITCYLNLHILNAAFIFSFSVLIFAGVAGIFYVTVQIDVTEVLSSLVWKSNTTCIHVYRPQSEGDNVLGTVCLSVHQCALSRLNSKEQ